MQYPPCISISSLDPVIRAHFCVDCILEEGTRGWVDKLLLLGSRRKILLFNRFDVELRPVLALSLYCGSSYMGSGHSSCMFVIVFGSKKYRGIVLM